MNFYIISGKVYQSPVWENVPTPCLPASPVHFSSSAPIRSNWITNACQRWKATHWLYIVSSANRCQSNSNVKCNWFNENNYKCDVMMWWCVMVEGRSVGFSWNIMKICQSCKLNFNTTHTRTHIGGCIIDRDEAGRRAGRLRSKGWWKDDCIGGVFKSCNEAHYGDRVIVVHP